MNEDERAEIEDWKVCYEVSVAFQAKQSAAQRCVNCSQVSEHRNDVFRSIFWIATRCNAGHGQLLPGERRAGTDAPEIGICGGCDKDYVLQVVKGKLMCRRNNCRRALRINKSMVRTMLSKSPDLLRKFLACVARYNVYECSIHCDECPFEEGTATPSDQCDHDRQVCNECLKSLFEASIRGGRLKELACPDVECRKPVGVDLIRELVSPECMKLYLKKLAFEAMADHPCFRWCTCGHGQIHLAGDTSPEWTCLSCKKRHCFTCKVDEGEEACEHLQRTSQLHRQEKAQSKKQAFEAYQRRQREQREQREKVENTRGTRDEIARTTKKCPKAGCQIPIFRDDGCAHMTCKKCTTDFCWCCKVIWKVTAGTATGGSNAKKLTVMHLNTCRIATKRKTALTSLDTRGYARDWNVDRGYDTSLDVDLWLISAHQ